MPIAILALALVAYVYALVASPGFRRWGLLLGAGIGLGFAVWFWEIAPQGPGHAPRIAASDLVIDQVALETTARGATLTGRVANGSPAFRLRDMTLNLRLHDCPAPDSDPAGCPVIGEARAIARPDAPPGQIRGFRAHFVFANLPPLTGTLRWNWSIAETRATD